MFIFASYQGQNRPFNVEWPLNLLNIKCDVGHRSFEKERASNGINRLFNTHTQFKNLLSFLAM